MHRYLPLLILVSACSQEADSISMSDQAFAQTVLSQAQIGQPLTAAQATLKQLGLDCAPVVAKPLPGTTPDPRFSEFSCSRPPPPQDKCWQRINLLAYDGKIASITLSFEQLLESTDGSACGR
jgi:hypothetical protein